MSQIRIKTRIILALAAAGMLMLAGCGGKEAVKPTAENVKANKALGVLAEMKKAYVERDMSGVLNLVSPSLEGGGYAEFSGRVRKDTETYKKVELDMTVDRVEISGERVGVVFHWFGKWHDASGNMAEGRGNSVFTFLDGEKMALVAITGDSPFGIVR